MSSRKGLSKGMTRFVVAAFALTTAVLLLPGYFQSWQAATPRDAEFYVKEAFERNTRVIYGDGSFNRLPREADFGAVTSFSCSRSSAARREFGWRGARELLFDCPAAFTDQEGRTYTWVFRLIGADDTQRGVSPEGYGTIHIDVIDALDILEQENLR